MAQLPIPSEYLEQLAVVEYLELRQLKFTAIPNSTYTPSMKQKMMNTAMGLRPGLPDLLVIIPNQALLFIEMKRQKHGVVSSAQREWIEALNTVPNVEAVVCAGADVAIQTIEGIIGPMGGSDTLAAETF